MTFRLWQCFLYGLPSPLDKMIQSFQMMRPRSQGSITQDMLRMVERTDIQEYLGEIISANVLNFFRLELAF